MLVFRVKVPESSALTLKANVLSFTLYCSRRVFADKSGSSVQIMLTRSSLPANKATVSRFSVQQCIPLCNQFHQQPFSNWSGNIHFSIVTCGGQIVGSRPVWLRPKPSVSFESFHLTLPVSIVLFLIEWETFFFYSFYNLDSLHIMLKVFTLRSNALKQQLHEIERTYFLKLICSSLNQTGNSRCMSILALLWSRHQSDTKLLVS